MAGKKNGSDDDLFGEFEDSFFKSGEDDSFWDDDTVVAYEESMALSKAELAQLQEKLDQEDDSEEVAAAAPAQPAPPAAQPPEPAPAPAAPAAPPIEEPAPQPEVPEPAAPTYSDAETASDASVADEPAPAAAPEPPAAEPEPAAATPAPAPAAGDTRPDPVHDFFRMAPPPTRPAPAPARPPSAPDRPADSALFSAPTLILPAGQAEALDEEESEDVAPTPPSTGLGSTETLVPSAAAGEEDLIAVGEAAPDDTTEEADARMVSEVLRRADEDDAPVKASHEPPPLDAGVMDEGYDDEEDDEDEDEDEDEAAAFVGLPPDQTLILRRPQAAPEQPAADPEPESSPEETPSTPVQSAETDAMAAASAEPTPSATLAPPQAQAAPAVPEQPFGSLSDVDLPTEVAPPPVETVETAETAPELPELAEDAATQVASAAPGVAAAMVGAGVAAAAVTAAPAAAQTTPSAPAPARTSPVLPPRRAVTTDTPSLSDAPPTRYTAASGDDEGWTEAAVTLEREGQAATGQQRARLLAAAGAIRFRMLGNWEAAEASFSEAVASGLDDGRLLRAYADIVASRGEFDRMRALLEKRAAVTSGVAASESLHDIALVERNSLRRPAEAVAILKQAIALDANDWFALRLLRELQHREGDWAGLTDTLSAMASLAWGAEAARLQVERGRILAEELHDTDAALAAWGAALDADPSYTPAFLARERGLASVGALPALVDLYDAEAARLEGADRGFYLARAARIAANAEVDADRVDQLFSSAITNGAGAAVRHAHQVWLARHGRYEALAASLEAEAEALTGAAAALPRYRLALVRERHLGDPDGALEALQQVVFADPSASPAVEAISRLLEQQGKHADLIAFLEKRVEMLTDPNLMVSNLYRMGEICEGPLNDPAGARVWFERILDTAPAYLPALEGLERVYQQVGAWAELAGLYEQRALLTDEPDAKAMAWQQAGSVSEFRLDDTARARGFYERALAASPAFPPALDAMARLLAAAGEWAALARTLAAAADACGESPEAVSLRYRSARVAADRCDDTDHALVQLRMCLELSPGFLPAIGLLRGLSTTTGDWAAVYQLHLQEASATEDLDRRHWRMMAAAEAAHQVDGVEPIDVVTGILEQDPAHPGALLMLEDHARATGDTGRLVDVYRRSAAHTDDDQERARVSAAIADVASGAGDAARTMEAIAELLGASGERPLVALSRLAETFGNWEEASRALQSADPVDRHADARLREAWSDDLQTVLDAWIAASEQDGGSPEAAAGLERALSRLGKREGLAAAHETIATGVETPSVRAVHAVLAAHLHAGAGDDEAAARCYALAFAARPGQGRAFDALLDRAISASDASAIHQLFSDLDAAGSLAEAEALGQAGLASEAVAVLQAALPAPEEQSVGDLSTLVQLEKNLSETGDWKGVFDVLARRRALSLSQEERSAIDGKRRWVLAEKLAETEEAWEFYRQLHEEDPTDAEVLESLARIAGARGETGLAIQYLEGLASVAADGVTAARYRRRIAEAQLARGDSDEAREAARAAYLAALDHNPEDLEALAGLRALAEQTEDWRALVGVLAREATVLSGDDQVARYRSIASTWEERIGDQGVAIDAWRKVLSVAPADSHALERLVDLTRTREDWAGFAEFAQARLPQLEGRDRTRLQSELGRVFFKRLYREDEAVRFLDAAISGDHPDSEAAELLERIYAARGQWDLVVEANLSRAQAAEGEERVALLLRAAQTRAETLHDRDGAAAIYAKVLEEQPDNAEALRFRGDWLYNNNDFSGAAEVFERMEGTENERDLDDFDVRIEVALYYFRFAEAQRKLDRTQAALGRYEQGLKLNPSHLPSLEAVGPLYMAQERWADAGNVYRQILQLTGGQGDPARLARTYVNLGKVELHQGNLDKAKKRFNKALDLRANDIRALQGIASVLFARKDWNNLLNVYNNIIYHAQEPAEVVDAYLTKGYVLDARLDLPDKAQQHYEKSLAFDPAQPKALLRLAELALRKQDWPDAASLAERGLALDVEDGAVLGGLHLVRAVAFSACNDDGSAGEAFAAALRADVTLTDRLGAAPSAWSQMHEVLRERLRARL